MNAKWFVFITYHNITHHKIMFSILFVFCIFIWFVLFVLYCIIFSFSIDSICSISWFKLFFHLKIFLAYFIMQYLVTSIEFRLFINKWIFFSKSKKKYCVCMLLSFSILMMYLCYVLTCFDLLLKLKMKNYISNWIHMISIAIDVISY